ncbi:MAG: PEP/pyruvate-binding domain-containing protein [Desulfobacterales bacterium]
MARLHQNGFNVPAAVCITTNAYQQFIRATGLATRIQMEINRKDFKDMRWEEIWDAALRIRNLFLRAPFPEKLDAALRGRLAPLFQDRAVAVRSTAPGEDDQGASFAGLHDSYVNVRGIDAIMDHVRLVWASLWSDAALLYRQEIGLSVIRSKMAVVVQEMIDGDRSGIIFTQNPANDRQSVIESVHGLNQGLVDGLFRRTDGLGSGLPAKYYPAYAGGPEKVATRSSRAVVRDSLPDKPMFRR